MSPTWRPALRGVMIAGGVVVLVASILQFRLADWPVYVVFLLLSGVLFLPSVEVLPRLALPIPALAVIIGFLYIAGMPVIVLQMFRPVVPWLLRRLLPAGWKDRIPQLRAEALVARRDLLIDGLQAGAGSTTVTEYATFVLGLGVRWWIVAALAPDGLPVTSAPAIAVAELGGYACWGLLSILSVYPDRSLIPLSSEESHRTAMADIGLIVMLALTPFVFLICYGFQTHGLRGAAAWSFSALGLHFVLKRLSERRLRVEEQNRRLETLNRELEHRERLSAIGKMSSVVSHQILQQLGVIGIHADLIRNADDSADPQTVVAQARSNAVAIEGAVGDVNRVLTDLLVFSRDLRLNLYAHPLARVIEECLDDCRAEAAEHGVHLRSDCPLAIEVTLDKLKMKQALVNVLRNSIEASPQGDEVLVRAAAHDGDVELTVSDHGPGVPQKDREAIFAPFFTTREHGSGLGLAIARVFTEAHGGRIWVEEPRDGSGATFVMRWPQVIREGAT